MTERRVTESVVEEAAVAWLESLNWRFKQSLDIAARESKAERIIGRVC